MRSVPAPLRRSLLLALIGTTLALAHVTFATAAPAQGTERPLPENCYVEVETVTDAAGRRVTRATIECD
jgi:hypothetical protein